MRGALDGAVEAFDGDRVGARDDQRLARARASTAARILPHISSAGISALPSRWPQRLGKSWSSSWIALAPARSNSRTVRTTLSALP